MSALAETLATAFVLSALAAGGLAVLTRTPPRVRFAIAMAGLAAWVVPWGALRLSLTSSAPVAAPLVEWLGAVPALAPATAPAEPGIAASRLFGYAVAAAFVVGLALLVRDCLALRRCVRIWRARSRPADELRALLPPDLAGVAAEIRLVENSTVAAASGVLRPTIWLGDRHAGAQRALALTHEMWHVRARDPAWLLAIAAVRRLYWWNPLVARLARHAVLMLESACDHRCAAQLGTASYVAQLASLLLEAPAPTPRLVATAGAKNLDVQRLRLLREPLRLRRRDVAVVAALVASSAVTAAAAVVEHAPAEIEPLGIALPGTPAGHALAALLGAANDGNSELLVALLGAYTPQELPMPLPSSTSVRIVEILHSDPLRIEYIVESANGARHVGELAVSISATTEITATRLRPLP